LPLTSTLITIQIPNPIIVLFHLLFDDACGVVLDAAAAR
jgi:hypothetical protein